MAEISGIEPHTVTNRTSRLAGGPYHRLGLISNLRRAEVSIPIPEGTTSFQD
jgi:hypothetical protein